jgi:hypothetical protein
MTGDLEKARQKVIDWAEIYVDNPADYSLAFVALERAVKSLKAIKRQSRPSDGGRMNEDSIGGDQ